MPDDILEEWDAGGREEQPRRRRRVAKTPASLSAIGEAPVAWPQADGLQLPPGFEMRPDGLYRLPTAADKLPFRVCGPLRVIAESRPQNHRDWGLVLGWSDRDGVQHEWIMPRRLLAGDAAEVRARLIACGLDISGFDGARRALVEFLASVKVSARVRTVTATGWYRPPGGGCVFVLPERTFGDAGGEVIRLAADPLPTIYRSRGTLQSWQREVAGRCANNSRLIFSVSCAFTGPLLAISNDEPGGANVVGDTSVGKTTMIDCGASAWGAPSKMIDGNEFTRTWRTTDNALEEMAVAHNHVLLPIDELAEADVRTLAHSVYTMGNGKGKARALPGGGQRATASFLTFVLSSGELTVTRLLEQAGQMVKGGMEVRLLDIPADAGNGHGVFEDLHGEESSAAFARALRAATVANHGTAGPAFVERVAALATTEPDFLAERVARPLREWMKRHVPGTADKQVQRAGRRFGMIAVAGEMATELGVTAWQPGAVSHAVARMLRDWLTARGGTGNRDDQRLVEAFRRFMMEAGASRFEWVKEAPRDIEGGQNEPALPHAERVVSRAGWRWQEADAEGRQRLVFGLSPAVFDAEIAAPLGMEGQDARGRLGRARMIVPGKEGAKTRWAWKCRRIPGIGRPMLIKIVMADWPDHADEATVPRRGRAGVAPP